ncbi:hypothetical protein [Paenibacillus dendritiformis]|uniref:hypothetical protein n=1 Tax=Paenibacillus dendritiformis TaxID=130049 RepID=UPI0011B70FC3|nr:hypothetical protein [Paenibacillus dendritiformis]
MRQPTTYPCSFPAIFSLIIAKKYDGTICGHPKYSDDICVGYKYESGKETPPSRHWHGSVSAKIVQVTQMRKIIYFLIAGIVLIAAIVIFTPNPKLGDLERR